MLAAGALPSADDTSETEASADPGQVPTKRMKIESVTKDLEGGSNSGREEVTQQTMTPAVATGGSGASHAAPIDTPPRLRLPPFPKTGDVNDVHKWNKEWRRISRILEKDPHLQLPTRRKPNDPDTTNAVLSSRDKVVVRCAARSIVNITSTMHDGSNGSQCTGIIMHQQEDNGKNRTLILTCSKIVCSGKKLLDPVPKLSVGLPDRTILDGRFLFFNDHYGIALLEVDTDCPLQPSSIGSRLEYGEEVFVLGRDNGLSLSVRQGKVLWSEESDYMGRSYQMFLSCELPMAGNGGPVIDHEGNIKGMVFYCNPDSAVLSISTIMICFQMWLKFRCIARPVHGLRVRTIALLDVSLQDEISLVYGVDSGFIVDKVRDDSAADRLGILPGDVIVSLNGHHGLTLPELEDYFLSLGWTFLNDRSSTVDLNLEVYDLIMKSKRSITLPVPFCDV